MSRLQSFRGPSTPSSSPVQFKSQTPPTSPARQNESTFHRKTRTFLQELQSISDTWDELVLIDGLKAARNLVDTRTDLDNLLALTPDIQPTTHMVGPKILTMEKCIIELDVVVQKLQKQFLRMNAIVENMETLVFEAYKAKGWRWVHGEPLWVSWSMEKIVTSISEILIPYHRSLNHHIEIVDKLRSHSVSFEDSRRCILEWTQQRHLEDTGWEAKWEEVFSVEVVRWSAKTR